MYEFDGDSGEMFLTNLHPGVSLDDVQQATSWELRVGEHVSETPAPTEQELRVMREQLDPQGIYTRGG